ncbi:MAG TPA: permease-like cell division protein FtsX [Kofleriaceae bacterium]
MWTLLALTAALFAVGVAALTAIHVETWTTAPRLGASMVVYLGDGVDEAKAQALAVDLAKLPGVERAELVTAADSAARLQQALGADSQLLEGVELASLPASVEVTLSPGMRDVIAMSPTVRALRGTPGVDDVIVEDAGAERVVGTLRSVRLVAWTGAALLAGLALIIVLAFIRVRLDRAEEELSVFHLLGASPSFIIVPTALAGALQGAIAALLATLALAAGVSRYGDGIADALHGALGNVTIALPATSMLVMFVALGAALGLVGGGLAGASRAVR